MTLVYGVTSFASALMTGVVELGSGKLFDVLGSAYAWGFSVAMTLIAVIASIILVSVDSRENVKYQE